MHLQYGTVLRFHSCIHAWTLFAVRAMMHPSVRTPELSHRHVPRLAILPRARPRGVRAVQRHGRPRRLRMHGVGQALAQEEKRPTARLRVDARRSKLRVRLVLIAVEPIAGPAQRHSKVGLQRLSDGRRETERVVVKA